MLRVSNSLLTNNRVNYIQKNLQQAAKLEEQNATGKIINRPSDDPSEISHLMAVNATITSNEQYKSNIQDGLSYLNQSDSALDTIGKTLQDAKIQALQGANGTMTKEDMAAIAEQIDRQVDALVDLANSALGGKYLFAGRKNGQPPFYRDPQSSDIYYRGDTNLISREITFGYSYEVVAAGVADNNIKGAIDLSEGKGLTAEDMKFKVEMGDGISAVIDLSDPALTNALATPTPPATTAFYKFTEIKAAMQEGLNAKLPPNQVSVSDDGKGHIILSANNDADSFRVIADGTNTGHLSLFGGDRSVVNGVFGKLSSPSNPANQIDDLMNSGEKMTKVLGGPFEVLMTLSKNLRNGDADAINESMKELDTAHDDILKQRVGVGARTRHLEAVMDQLNDQEIKLKEVLVNIQGADIYKLTIETAQNLLVQQASYMTTSKLLNTNLLQYLR